MAKTLPKYLTPSHSELSLVRMPVSDIYLQITATFSKVQQRKLLTALDENEVIALVNVSMGDLGGIEDKIISFLFEEDLVDLENPEFK